MITRSCSSRLRTRTLVITLLICVAWMRSSLTVSAAESAPDGALLEPDIAVVDYVSPPSLLDAMPLFDSTQTAAGGQQRRPPSHTRPPPPLPHMQPPPVGAGAGAAAGAPQGQGRRAPPPPPPRRGEPRPVASSPSGAQPYPPPPPSQPQPRQQPAGKRPAAPPQRKQQRAQSSKPAAKSNAPKHKQPQQQQNKNNKKKKQKRARRAVPAFDGGEVKPAQARHPRQPPPAAAAPRPAAPATASPPPRVGPAAPKPAGASPPVPVPVPELSRAQIRAEQARLYEQQKQKYAQLVAFHRGEPGATYPSGFDSAAAGSESKPEVEPSLEELREMLRREGLLTPPSAADTAEAAELEGGFGRGLFSVPPPRERQYDLTPLPKGHVPLWKKQQAGQKRRRRPVPAGAVDSLARVASLRSKTRGAARGPSARAQTEAAFADMKSQLLSDLSSEKGTAQLREQIERLLREQLAKMSPEEMEAEIARLQEHHNQRAEGPVDPAAAVAAATPAAPATASTPAPPPAAAAPAAAAHR